MAFARTIPSLITAAGLCVWAPCSSSTFKLTAILGSTSTSAFSPRAASSLPTTLLKPSARHSRSSPRKVRHAWRPESALGLLQVGAATRAAEELDDYFAGLSPLIHAGATGLLFSYIGPESRRMSLKTWVHDFDQLRGRQRPRHGTWPAEVEGTFMELRAANGPMT